MPTVEYLEYEVITANSWVMDDESPFEMAADAELGRDNHGSHAAIQREYILERHVT